MNYSFRMLAKIWKYTFLLAKFCSNYWTNNGHLILSYLSCSLAERWGITVEFTTSFLHSSRFSAFHSMMFHSRPVHSLMLSSHLFLCLPLRPTPWTVPCRIVLASPDDCVMCPYHFSLHLFTEVKVFIRPDGAFSSGFHFLIGYVISVRDSEEFVETSHLQCLYPFLNICCYGPRFICIQKYGHGQGTHQSDLGADGDVLVVPDDF